MASKYSNIQIVGGDDGHVKVTLDESQWTHDELRLLAAYRINGGAQVHFASIKDISMCITAESMKPKAQRQVFHVLFVKRVRSTEEATVH